MNKRDTKRENNKQVKYIRNRIRKESNQIV